MPRSVLYIVFILPDIIDTPLKRAYSGVFSECLVEKVASIIGHEANLADIGYSIKLFENVGLKLKFTGYNDKLLVFV
jgi:secreted Zn-dependent insulinase-like peptidase